MESTSLPREKELRDFYLLDDKLLFVCDDFIGFNPTISEGLTFKKRKYSGTKVKVQEFEMHGSSFIAILPQFIDWGPLRGYRRVEILKNGRTIIRFERGGKGHGSIYFEGNEFHVEYGNAYLISEGYSMRYLNSDRIYKDLKAENFYLLWIKGIVVPKKSVRNIAAIGLDQKGIFTSQEIEPFRQLEWEANVQFNNQNINIVKTSIPGFMNTRTYNGLYEFKLCKNSTTLNKIEIKLVD